MATYEKKQITYIVEEPPPKQQPQFIPDWWIKNKLHIKILICYRVKKDSNCFEVKKREKSLAHGNRCLVKKKF